MITRILEDFSGFISGSGGTVRVPSMDHALAVQIRVCHDLLERSDFEGLPNSDVMSLVTDLLPH
ncbi:hypothetical protein ACT3SQ_19280, partial [Brachybacterium sp. AOP42-C2-15]|uniref:hypothetical protein n=1 Tax=Brachybacterium sp. AOP42-C2-15 TaxID=3457670 RepID=UPI004034F2F3